MHRIVLILMFGGFCTACSERRADVQANGRCRTNGNVTGLFLSHKSAYKESNEWLGKHVQERSHKKALQIPDADLDALLTLANLEVPQSSDMTLIRNLPALSTVSFDGHYNKATFGYDKDLAFLTTMSRLESITLPVRKKGSPAFQKLVANCPDRKIRFAYY